MKIHPILIASLVLTSLPVRAEETAPVAAVSAAVPSRSARIVNEALLGGLGTLVVGGLGALAGWSLECTIPGREWCGLGGGLGGALVGGTLGAGVGVWGAGALAKGSGSYLGAQLGALTSGALAAGAYLLLANSTSLDARIAIPLVVLVAVAPTVGAVIGYELTHDWAMEKRSALVPTSSAVVPLQGGAAVALGWTL